MYQGVLHDEETAGAFGVDKMAGGLHNMPQVGENLRNTYGGFVGNREYIMLGLYGDDIPHSLLRTSKNMPTLPCG